MTIEERFWNKVNKTNNVNDCWEWIGAKINKGYGRIKINKKGVLAHRFSYELYNKSIDSNLMICHKCDNPSCVNPNHLFQGTRSDNMKDAFKKGRLNIPDPPEGVRFEKGNIPLNKTISNELMLEIKKAIDNKGKQTIKSICKKFNVNYQSVRDMRRKNKITYKTL